MDFVWIKAIFNSFNVEGFAWLEISIFSAGLVISKNYSRPFLVLFVCAMLLMKNKHFLNRQCCDSVDPFFVKQKSIWAPL